MHACETPDFAFYLVSCYNIENLQEGAALGKTDAKRKQSNILARECLVQALMELLESRSLSSISISELTQKAGVSRMTYYRNYHSLDEIFTTYLNDILAAYREDISGWADKGNYNDYKNMLHCYSYFYAHRDFIRCLLKCGMGDILLHALTEYIVETYYAPAKGIEVYYTLQAFAGSLYNIYISWILNDTKESAEEMAAIICGIYS